MRAILPDGLSRMVFMAPLGGRRTGGAVVF